MGFFDIFKKKPSAQSNAGGRLEIDMNKDGIFVNGKRFEIPVHVSVLEDALGKGRAVSYKTNRDSREFLEQIHGEGLVDKRVNYAWDDLGIYCYTFNGVVSCIGVRLNATDRVLKHDPKRLFSGVLTINSKPWFDVIRAGKDCDVLQEVRSGEYLISAEYVDFEQTPETVSEKSYTGVEIQLGAGLSGSE